jgi:hypothetical protein
LSEKKGWHQIREQARGTPSGRPAQAEGSGSQNVQSNQSTAGGASGNHGQRHRQGGRAGRERDQQTPRATKFEGSCDALKGHIYDYTSPRQAADQYTKTTREICEYVGSTFKYGADTKTALETLAVPTFPEPVDPPAGATRTQERIWEKQVDEHVKRGNFLVENLKMAYSLVYGQCSDALRVKLESRPNHAMIEANADSIALLENIRTVMF